MKETDDAIASKVRRVRQWRAPVAVGSNQHVLMEECGVTRHELANCVGIVAADRVGEPYGVNEPRPARCVIASCQHELRVRQLRGGGIDELRMVLVQFGDRTCVAGTNGAKKFLGLTMKLLRVWPDR